MPRLRPLDDPAPDPVRVLIVDDSAVSRAILARMVETTGRFVVVHACASAAAALDFLAHRSTDVVLLDLQMPGVDGLTALPDVITASGGAKVLVVSSAATAGAATTVQALALGAADTLVKPGTGEPTTRFVKVLHDKLRRLADRSPAPTPAASAAPADPLGAAGEGYDVVAVGASTGGIHALSSMLHEIPRDFPLPIIVTQHLPASFMPYFAAQLAVIAGRPCDVAVDRLRIRPGRLIVAPGDAHLRCVRLPDGGAAIRLSKEPSQSGCIPSVDPMLSSMADVYGGRMLAVMLSGMGRDGAIGARDVREAGGGVVVQDRATSVIWGMPGAVAQGGLAHAVLSPTQIGQLVASGRRA